MRKRVYLGVTESTSRDMGKGRAPCCDKSQVKRGPWSSAEDLRLITFIQKHGHENWRALPKQAGLLRCGKSCRLRWINYLRPDVKRGNFTTQEEDTIIKLHHSLGNKWSKIASHFPGRTDNEIKNIWNTHLKKRLALKDHSHGDETKESSITSSSSSSSTSFMSYGKRNIEMVLDHEHHQSDDHDPVAKKPCEGSEMTLDQENVQDSQKESSNGIIPTKDDPKELSSPISSNDSNISNPAEANHVSMQEEKMASMFNYIGPYDVHDTLQEVNKPDSSDNNALEIPLESDIDFWDMLDNLGAFQSNYEVLLREAEACQSSNFGREAENGKWLRYLENELGLEASRGENQENLTKDTADHDHQPLVPDQTFHHEIQIFKPEIDPGMSYSQMWPSWPQNSAV